MSTQERGRQCLGAQYEAAPPRLRIPTVAAVVTRNEDVLQYATLNNLDGATATTYAEIFLPFRTPSTRVVLRTTGPPIGSPQYVLATLDAATLYAQGVNRGTNNNSLYVGNDALNKIASAYSGTTDSICSNGGEVAVGSGVVAPFYPNTGNFSSAPSPAPGLRPFAHDPQRGVLARARPALSCRR
jgi:hypothetical protein